MKTDFQTLFICDFIAEIEAIISLCETISNEPGKEVFATRKHGYHMEQVWATLESWIGNLTHFVLTYGVRLLVAVLVYCLGSIICKLIIGKMSRSKALTEKSDPTVRLFADKALRITCKILLLSIAVAILGIPMASITALIASAGVAIGLALQGGLSNIAGGIMLLIFKPFKIGDYITTSSGNGTVSEIGIFYTTLLSPDNKRIVIPNGTVSGNAVENYSTEDRRRVDFTVSVSYGTNVQLVKDTLFALADAHEAVFQDPAPMCRLAEFGESSLNFTFRVWTKTKDYWTVKFDLNESIKSAFEEKGIHIPYPQLDVHTK